MLRERRYSPLHRYARVQEDGMRSTGHWRSDSRTRYPLRRNGEPKAGEPLGLSGFLGNVESWSPGEGASAPAAFPGVRVADLDCMCELFLARMRADFRGVPTIWPHSKSRGRIQNSAQVDRFAPSPQLNHQLWQSHFLSQTAARPPFPATPAAAMAHFGGNATPRPIH